MIPRILLGLIACTIPALSSAQSIREPRLHVLDNGIRVLTVEDRTSPLVSVTWSAHVGDSAEPLDFTGNSHFLEHLLLFRGTESYPQNQIGEWVAARGGYFNGHTWYDYTTFEIMCARTDLAGALDRHAEMMFHATFSGEDFELEKKAVFEEFRSGRDRPYSYLWQTAPYAMYEAETFYSRSTIGTIEAVEGATADQVRRYYERYYVPGNITLSIVGDIETEEALTQVRERFARYPAQRAPDAPYEALPMKPGITLVTEEREIGKAYFLLAVPGPEAASPEYFPFVLLSAYLANGKTALLREELVTRRELLDELSFDPMPRRFARGWQALDAEGSPDDVVEATAALWELLGRVGAGDFSDEDIHLARQRLISSHRTARDDPFRVATALVEADAHGDYRLFSEFEERLAAVTRADIQAVARKYLTPDHFFLLSLFPTGEIPAGFETAVREVAGRHTGLRGGVASRALESGVTLLHEARPGATVESFTVAVQAGDRDGDTPGVAQAVAQMMTRATHDRSKKELQDTLDRSGFQLASWTSSDAAFFSLQLPAGSTSQAASLLAEVLTTPGFSEDEWEATRSEIVAAVQRQLDQPQPVALDALISTIFADDGYGRSMEDVIGGVTGLTSGDLRSFWKEHYRAGSMAVAYCGDATVEQVAEALEPLEAIRGTGPSRRTVPATRAEKIVRSAEPMEGKAQANLYLAWTAPPIDSDDWIRWQLAQRAIGGDLAGRLWKLRQDEGLAYSVWLGGIDLRDRPLTRVYMATAGEKRERALAAIDREVRSAMSGLTSDELDRVKVSYLASLNRFDRTAARRSDRLATWWSQGLAPERRARLEKVIAATSLDAVNRVVAEVLDPERYFFAEAGAVPE